MKKIFTLMFALMTFAIVIPALESCNKENGEEQTADTTALETELAECKALIGDATSEDYPQTAIDAFQKVISTVETALEKGISQTEATNLLTQLQAAKKTFESAAYGAIPEESILLSYDFDTEGETQVSTGSLKWEAKMAKGPSELYGTDTGLPTFVEGVSGKAISFDKGSHLEISDYALNSILTTNFSLSVWVNLRETVAGNYIISANYWNNFKFNVQTENKPFFTLATDQGTIDADNETAQSVTNNAWTHLVVTLSYDTNELKFYVNGELTKTWDDTGKPALAGTWASEYSSKTGKKLPLMIGTCTTYEEANTVWDWDWAHTSEYWQKENCLNGAIDELKIFNIALTDGQVEKLYNDEK